MIASNLKGSFLSSKTFTVAAGQSVSHNVSGAFFACKESNNTFLLGLDGNEPFPMEVGLSVRLEPPDFFTRLTFTNPTLYDITITYYAGRGEVRDGRLNTLFERNITVTLKDPATYAKGHSDAPGAKYLTLTPNAVLWMPGVDQGQPRKTLIVGNLSGSPLAVIDSPIQALCTVLCSVPQGSNLPIESSAPLGLWNVSAGNNQVFACELFYSP
jgi:hypothetical protein